MGRTGETEVLGFLSSGATRPLRPVDIARALEVPREEYREFRELLRGMERAGLVYRQRKGRYAIPRNLNLAVGRLEVTRSGDGFVTREDGADVYVPGRFLGTAVEGDTVVARIERRRRGRNPEGRVIRVLERAWRQLVGCYHRREGYGTLAPIEPPLDVEFVVPGGLEGGAEDGEIVAATVVEWEPAPVARVERRLGRPGEPGVDVLAIVHGRGLAVDFPAAALRDARRLARHGPGGAAEGREDLRSEVAFTIDPADAKDHDDAVSIRSLGGDRSLVGVHIADVGAYVEVDGAIDAEALERATSVYLVDRVLPMLPHELSGDLCSLRPGVDRLTLSVLFTVDGGGRPLSERIVRSVIRSRRRLAYDEAQAIMDGEAGAEPEIAAALAGLRRVSRGIRSARLGRGSLDFDLPEARVVLNSAGEPTDIQRLLRLESHLLIEDLMILANETVARLALREGLPMIFRIHEPPAEDRIEALRKLAATFGHHLPRRRSRRAALPKLLAAVRGTLHEALVSTATLRSLKQARYSAANAGHFGLASEAYAHFTSPIRRYPDLVAHRQVTRWLAGARDGPGTERLEEIAVHCSERERQATEAERDSVDLKKVEFMERHVGETFAGAVSAVVPFGFFVLLRDYHVEGLVHVSTLDDDYYEHVEEQHLLIGRRHRRRIRIGDAVEVRLVRVDREERKIDLELSPPPGGRGRGP